MASFLPIFNLFFMLFSTRSSRVTLVHVWRWAGHHTGGPAPCHLWNLQQNYHLIPLPHHLHLFSTSFSVDILLWLLKKGTERREKSNWKYNKNHNKVLKVQKKKSSTTFMFSKNIKKCIQEVAFFQLFLFGGGWAGEPSSSLSLLVSCCSEGGEGGRLEDLWQRHGTWVFFLCGISFF